MIVRNNKGYETNSMFPNTDWYNEGNYVVDETTKEGKIIAEKIIKNYPYYELVLDEDGNLIDVTLTVKPIEPERKKKIEELKTSCSQSIYEGFTASNGSIYGFNELDQANFTQQSILILSGHTGIIKWKTKNNGVVDHTVEEFNTVINEAANHKLTQQEKYWTLETQVLAATTIEELNAIVW